MKLFFDLDGTIIDVSKRHHRVYSELVEQFGGVALSMELYWELKRQKTPWPELLIRSNVAVDKLDEFLKAFILKIESPDYLKMDKLIPGALNVVIALSKKHDCYLVSLRRNGTNLQQELDWLKLTEHFTKVLYGHSETDGFDVKIALIKDVLDSTRAIIIGDTEADIVTGQQLGIKTAAVLSGIRDEQFLTKLHPDYMMSSVALLTDIVPND